MKTTVRACSRHTWDLRLCTFHVVIPVVDIRQVENPEGLLSSGGVLACKIRIGLSRSAKLGHFSLRESGVPL